MQLHFDSTTDGPDDALAIIVALTMRYNLGEAAAPAPFHPQSHSERGQPGALPSNPDAPSAAFGDAPPPPPPTATASPATPTAPPEAGVPFPPASSVTEQASEPAPSAPAAPATAPAASVTTLTTPPTQVDSSGMPWDARIHAGNRATIKDGTWRKKPGVDKDTLAQVEAELKAAAPQAVAAAPPPPPPAPAAPTPPPPAPPVASVAPAPPAPAATTAPTPPPPPPPPAPSDGQAPATVRFAAVLPKVTEALTAQKLTQADVDAIGVQVVATYASLADILTAEVNNSVPGAIDVFAALLDAKLAGVA